jgi:two-component system sensor histidine kinase/response regulator
MSGTELSRFMSIGRSALIAGALIITVCVSIVAVEAWTIEAARRTQIAEASAASTNLARSVAEMTTSTFVQADLVVASLVERIETDGIAVASSERFRHLLHERETALAQIQGLAILDANGRWIATDRAGDARADHDEREYFRYHRTHEDTAPHLGPPVRTQSTNEWIVTVSRRFNDSEGRFAGVAVASVPLTFFNAYLS